jgi:hydrogenase-4 membrane subunit HyfE
VKSFLSFRSVILLVASIVPWRLVYAFIEKEECSKEEKAFGQSWEITRISYVVFMLVFVVHLLRR